MGALDRKHSRLISLPIATFLLGLLLMAFVLLPLFRLLASLTLDFDGSVLTSPFWQLLAKSVFFTSIQAFLSAGLTLALALLTALPLSHTVRSRGLDRICRGFGAFGHFVFFLPSLSSALFVMSLAQNVPWLPSQGLGAVVLAHFFINFFYLFGKFYAKSRAYLNGTGENLFHGAWLLGLPRLQSYRLVWGPLLASEVRSWFPLIFWWSFSNFATLLILGGLRYSSPEILLFLSMQNDPGSSRLLVLVAVQLLGGIAMARFFSSPARTAESFEIENQRQTPLPSRRGDGLAQSSAIALLVGLFVPQAWFFIRTLLAPLQTPLPSSLSEAILPSFSFAGLTVVFSLGFSVLLCLGSATLRRAFTLLLGLSATIFCLAYVSTELGQNLLDSTFASFFLMALAQSLIFLPSAAIWLHPRMQSLPQNQIDSAFCLGLSRWSFFRWVVWPLSRDLWWRIGIFSFIGALGEIVVTSLFRPDTEFLATAARKLSSRYDFDSAAWIIVFYTISVLLCLGLAWVLKTRQKGLRHGR